MWPNPSWRRPEGDSGREVSLDESGDDIHGRPLRGKHDVQTGGTPLLSEPDDGRGDAAGHSLGITAATDRHRQVSIFIYDGDYVREEAVPFGRKKLPVAILLVVSLYVRHGGLAQQLVALIHLDAE